MKLFLVHRPSVLASVSPYRLLDEQGQEIAWANAFLDALAHHRRAQGRPGLSINWGPWGEAGMAADTARAIRAEATVLANHFREAGDDGEGKAGRKRAAATFAFALKSEEEPRLRRMLEVGKSMPTVVVTPTQLDADPWLLNTPAGTVDLRTGQVRAHDQRDLHRATPESVCSRRTSPTVMSSGGRVRW